MCAPNIIQQHIPLFGHQTFSLSLFEKKLISRWGPMMECIWMWNLIWSTITTFLFSVCRTDLSPLLDLQEALWFCLAFIATRSECSWNQGLRRRRHWQQSNYYHKSTRKQSNTNHGCCSGCSGGRSSVGSFHWQSSSHSSIRSSSARPRSSLRPPQDARPGVRQTRIPWGRSERFGRDPRVPAQNSNL